MITLHGVAASRASRCLLALEELEVPYRHVPLSPWSNETDAEALSRINPNARVPVLEDGTLVLWESMAINLYLGDRYGASPLWPAEAGDRARLYQWSLWSQTEVDVRARHFARFSPDAEVKAKAEAERLEALQILDRVLAQTPYLLGEGFTLADLNVASTLCEPWEDGRVDGELDPAAHGLPALADWLARCVGRDAWSRVRALA